MPVLTLVRYGKSGVQRPGLVVSSQEGRRTGGIVTRFMTVSLMSGIVVRIGCVTWQERYTLVLVQVLRLLHQHRVYCIPVPD